MTLLFSPIPYSPALQESTPFETGLSCFPHLLLLSASQNALVEGLPSWSGLSFGEESQRGSKEADGGSHQLPPPHRESDPHWPQLSHPISRSLPSLANSQDPCRGPGDQTTAQDTKGRGFLGASGIHNPKRVLAGTMHRPSFSGHKARARWPA